MDAGSDAMRWQPDTRGGALPVGPGAASAWRGSLRAPLAGRAPQGRLSGRRQTRAQRWAGRGGRATARAPRAGERGARAGSRPASASSPCASPPCARRRTGSSSRGRTPPAPPRPWSPWTSWWPPPASGPTWPRCASCAWPSTRRSRRPVALAPLIDPNVHSCGTVPPHGAPVLAHPEPGFYVVGMKSYGRAPTFLLLTGYEQVRSVAAALTGDEAGARTVELVLPETGVCSAAGPGRAAAAATTTTTTRRPARARPGRSRPWSLPGRPAAARAAAPGAEQGRPPSPALGSCIDTFRFMSVGCDSVDRQYSI